ncbi:unnamed protein product [Amoebophrya sp. A25]|nr:unnamed protein product [Amoebophrya sp. A25]|eukprot:GSA25T00018972001.1
MRLETPQGSDAATQLRPVEEWGARNVVPGSNTSGDQEQEQLLLTKSNESEPQPASSSHTRASVTISTPAATENASDVESFFSLHSLDTLREFHPRTSSTSALACIQHKFENLAFRTRTVTPSCFQRYEVFQKYILKSAPAFVLLVLLLLSFFVRNYKRCGSGSRGFSGTEKSAFLEQAVPEHSETQRKEGGSRRKRTPISGKRTKSLLNRADENFFVLL